MRTVVLGERPPELEALIARRRALGLDMFDEVWDGDYHMNPAPAGPHSWIDQQLAELLGPWARQAGLWMGDVFNLGVVGDFRVPDRGIHTAPPVQTWFDTAVMAIEVESPGDESWDKLGFYAAYHVDEVLIVSPEKRTVNWLLLDHGNYIDRGGSAALGVTSDELASQLEWPPPS
jgi:hypothetical protein